MKIILSKKEVGAMNDYLGTLIGTIPKSMREDKETKEALNRFKASQEMELNEDYIIETIRDACDLTIASEEQILLIFSLLNSVEREDLDAFNKDIKEAFVEVMNKTYRRKALCGALNRIIFNAKYAMRRNKNRIRRNNKEHKGVVVANG